MILDEPSNHLDIGRHRMARRVFGRKLGGHDRGEPPTAISSTV